MQCKVRVLTCDMTTLYVISNFTAILFRYFAAPWKIPESCSHSCSSLPRSKMTPHMYGFKLALAKQQDLVHYGQSSISTVFISASFFLKLSGHVAGCLFCTFILWYINCSRLRSELDHQYYTNQGMNFFLKRDPCLNGTTGGPRISWFLGPKWYHEIWGSRILKPFLVLNPELGPKIF